MESTTEETQRSPKFTHKLLAISKSKSLLALCAILVAVLIFSLFQLYRAHQELKQFKSNPEQATSEEVDKLVSAVSKLIDLPKDEKPTVATVKDPEKLKNQTFFEKARTDNKVLIYNNAKLAILYRPASNKILNVAPINIGADQGKIAGQKTQGKLKFIILNGTKVAGLAGRFQEQIKNKIPDSEIASISNSPSNNVEKTFIAVSSQKNATRLADIAKLMGIETGSLPKDQLDENADFIIVVGLDKSSL